MVPFTNQSKVLIIGAGIAGLSLAQILRKQCIAFEIFERDDGNYSQGWAVALDKCLDDLEPLLPDDLHSLKEASPNFKGEISDGYAIVDGRTHELVGVVGNVRKGHPKYNISANRNVIRRILWENLHVQTKKRLLRYEEDYEGVTAHFTDGTSTHGSILVGGDGAQSIVRSQLFPGFKPDPSIYVMLHGNVVLAKDLYEPLLSHANTGILIGEPGMKFYIIVIEYLKDDTAQFNWTCAWRDEDPDQDERAWAQSATQEELFGRALELLKNLPPQILEAVKRTGPEGMHQPPIKLTETILPAVSSLPRGFVTLMGDAAHSMVPFRGMGANTAILDACDLGMALTAGMRDGRDLQWIMKTYEEKMIPRGRTKVLESRATGESTDTSEIAGGRLQE